MAAASTYLFEKVNGDGLITRASLFTSQENNFLFAYCGYSLAVGDFDANGLEDVVVGCPWYDKDIGAIVIFYQKKSGNSYKMEMESQHRFGLDPEARFGSSISWIEDMDGDGYRGDEGYNDIEILRAEKGMTNFGWAIASGSGNLAVSAYGQSVAVFK
ncbi:integrin alpha-PS5-like [Hyalella azteca]|uniref:Integrin alpha-PS5-like n=1 Tax=Hyalella azteca TaxID=294128 RepID=A0A8B7NZ16_HYAAZ|nr:integrin alpha-PS5-like [Hyalella azteca]